jgi:DNA-binding MarR family transcriptional regulator
MTEERIAELLRIKEVLVEHLPVGVSFISLDILLTVYHQWIGSREEGCQMKHLFNSLPYSEMGIRIQLRRLVERGWLSLQPGKSDRRKKYVLITPKTFERFKLLDAQLFGSFKPRR